jgi:hypothetical protein
MLKIISVISIFVCFSTVSFAAQKSKPKVPQVKVANSNVMASIIGSYQRHDQKFMYLKVRGAKKMIKIPRKYSLNSPANYTKGLSLKLEVPIKELISLNK